jgi:hypothetical protein
MNVHYIWLGNDTIPQNYINNFQKCSGINSGFLFQTWKNNDCLKLLEENNLLEYWSGLSFICKYNLVKYLILDKFGGIYTDFDIIWKQPFWKVMNDFKFGEADIIATVLDASYIDDKGIRYPLIDDPFIISKPNILGPCIEFCKNRIHLKNDGDHYLKTGELVLHKSEPVGPFGLTEWVYKNQIKMHYFAQQGMLDHNGYFGNHLQKNNWKSL